MLRRAEPNSVVTGRAWKRLLGAKTMSGIRRTRPRGRRGIEGWQAVERRQTSRRGVRRCAAKLKESLREAPISLQPQLALQSAASLPGDGWLHELKLDGYRIQARKDGDAVQLLTRPGWTGRTGCGRLRLVASCPRRR